MSGRETEIQFLVPISLLSALLHGTDADDGQEGNISISRSECASSERSRGDLLYRATLRTRGSPPSPPHDLSPETAPSDRRLLSARFAVTPSRTAASLGDTV